MSLLRKVVGRRHRDRVTLLYSHNDKFYQAVHGVGTGGLGGGSSPQHLNQGGPSKGVYYCITGAVKWIFIQYSVPNQAHAQISTVTKLCPPSRLKNYCWSLAVFPTTIA